MIPRSSRSDSKATREFYLPAMTVRSNVPGRLERFVTARLSDKSQLVNDAVPELPAREFYLPATAVLTNVPGPVQRSVSKLLRNRDDRGSIDLSRDELSEFYLPATPRSSPPRR